MFVFGSGAMIVQRSDIANGTPVNIGLLQDIAIDIPFTTKMLYGQNNFPVAVGRGTAKPTGKAKIARISGIALASVLFGTATVAGQVATQFSEAKTVASTTATSSLANAVADLGLTYASSGLPLVQVTSAPAVGQYSVAIAAGVITWTVNAADPGKSALLASYTYTIAGSGENFTLSQSLLGTTPTFQAWFSAIDPTTTKQLNIQFPNCVASKLNLTTKLEDFTIPAFDFDIFANAAGNVMTISTWDVG